MTVHVKETTGGTPIRSRTVNGEQVQAADAYPAPRHYFTPRELIALHSDNLVHELTVPTGARFATGRLVGSSDTDYANFSFGEDPGAAIGQGEPIYHKEEIDIAAPDEFRIIKGSTTGNLWLIVHYWDVA